MWNAHVECDLSNTDKIEFPGDNKHPWLTTWTMLDTLSTAYAYINEKLSLAYTFPYIAFNGYVIIINAAIFICNKILTTK